MNTKHLKAAFIMLFIAAAVSCKKNHSTQDAAGDKSAAMKAISGVTGTTPAFPKVENGMLVFNDEQHFEKYIAFLDKATDPQSYDSATLREKEFDQDAILETIEGYMGFTSVRKISHDKFMVLNETGWDRLEDIPAEHFISDAVIRSVLNENLAVKIGGSYVRYINKNISVKVDANAGNEIWASFSSLPETATLSEVLRIDVGHQHSSVFDFTDNGNLSIFDKDKYHTLGEGDLSIINLNYNAPDCNNPKNILFTGMQLWQQMPSGSLQNGILEGSFIVNFGDNTAPQTYYSYYTPGSQNSEAIVPNFTHSYANAGTYTVKVHATANLVYAGATSNTADKEYQVEVTGTTCKSDIDKVTEDERHTVTDGSRAWSGKITMTRLMPWFTWKRRVVSETSSWLRDGNKWKQSKSEIWHQLHTERMQQGSCNVLGQVDGDGWASSSKHITTHRTDDPYYWNKVTTKHGMKYNGTWYYFDKSISVCD